MTEIVALAGSLVGGAYALIRFALTESRGITNRFTSFLEDTLKRQETAQERFAEALSSLTDSVQDQSRLLSRLAERLNTK